MLWVYRLKWGRTRHALAEKNIGELVKKNDEFETCPKPTTKKDVLEKTEELCIQSCPEDRRNSEQQ
jgi:hypothetical protein